MLYEIRTYEGLKACPFGTSQTSFLNTLGTPTLKRKNRSGETVFHYDGFIACFDKVTQEFREATFACDIPIQLNDSQVNWSSEGLKQLCVQDGNPLQVYGTIVLLHLGVSITGLSDDERELRALSAFRRGDWDKFKSDFRPWQGP